MKAQLFKLELTRVVKMAIARLDRGTVGIGDDCSCRDLTEQYRDLAAELSRRRKVAELGAGQGAGTTGAVLPVVWEGEV